MSANETPKGGTVPAAGGGQQPSGISLTTAERNRMVVLVVESDANLRNNLRAALLSLALGGVTDAPSHSAAIEKLQERKITHIIFEAKKTTMPPKEFVEKALSLDPTIIAIPTSFEPNVDDVFDLLVAGAKGYLSKPFNADSVDGALVMATKAEPISPAVLNAKDRNEGLAALCLSSLDKVATVYRQAQQFETARREIPRAASIFKRSCDLARTFCKGGPDGFLKSLEKLCIERGQGPATKLGRLRKKLRTTRSPEEEAKEQTGA
jgi:DNA-binding NarL/FixJ family response regulator